MSGEEKYAVHIGSAPLVAPAAEPVTDELPRAPAAVAAAPADRWRVRAALVAFVALTVVLVDCGAAVLPDDPVVGVLTPLRLVVVVGLAGVAVARPRATLDGTRIVLLVGVAVLLAAGALAAAAAGSGFASWRGLLTAVAVGLLAAGVRRAVPAAHSAMGLLAMALTAVAALPAVHQVTGGVATGFCRAAVDGSADVCGPGALVRAVGTFANPNLLAAFLVLLLPLAAAGAAGLAERAARVVGAVVVVVGYAAVVLTGSRGGVLAALVGAAVFVVLRRASRRRLAAAAVLGTGGLAIVTALGHGDVGVRAQVWRAAVRLVPAHPLGVGPGRAGALIDAAVPGPEMFQHAHDLWLNQLVELGWAGGLACVAVTGCAVRLVTTGPRVASWPTAAIGAGLAGFAVTSVFDHPANAVRMALTLSAVLGLAAGGPVERVVARRRGAGPAGAP